MKTWKDIAVAYAEGRVRCRNCGYEVRERMHCPVCLGGRAVVADRGVLFIWGEIVVREEPV